MSEALPCAASVACAFRAVCWCASYFSRAGGKIRLAFFLPPGVETGRRHSLSGPHLLYLVNGLLLYGPSLYFWKTRFCLGLVHATYRLCGSERLF
jgi:hypothetical protein